MNGDPMAIQGGNAPTGPQGPADVAVVIPVYGRPRLVLKALESVSAQTLVPSRVVIVDDGSRDGTAGAVADWLSSSPTPFDARLREQAHSGASASRNRGLADSVHCAFVAFLDSDDTWPPDFLSRCVTLLEANPAAVAVSCDQCVHTPKRRGDPPRTEHQLRSLQALREDATRWFVRNDGAVLSASVFRTDVVRQLGGFDEGLATGQDWKLVLEASLRGPWLHAPGAPVEMGLGHVGSEDEGHLSLKFSDRHRRWARILEEFAHEAALPAQSIASAAGCRWLRASRELAESRRPVQALFCLHRALLWWWRRLQNR